MTNLSKPTEPNTDYMRDLASPVCKYVSLNEDGTSCFHNEGGLTKFEHVKLAILTAIIASGSSNADSEDHADAMAHDFFGGGNGTN